MSGAGAWLQPMLAPLGWALIHLLWQGLLVAGVLELALAFVGPAKARARYFLCGVALAALPVCFAATLAQQMQAVPAPMTVSATIPTVEYTPPAQPQPLDQLPVVSLDYRQ